VTYAQAKISIACTLAAQTRRLPLAMLARCRVSSWEVACIGPGGLLA